VASLGSTSRRGLDGSAMSCAVIRDVGGTIGRFSGFLIGEVNLLNGFSGHRAQRLRSATFWCSEAQPMSQ
jgi:hypothetical protein